MSALSTSKLFGSLSAAELQELERAAELRSYGAGSPVFQEGDPGDGLYLIRQGAVKISCVVGPDRRCVLSRLEAGDFFGEMAVFDNQARSATATAETDLEVDFLPSREILRAVERSPALSVSLVREFSLRMRDFNHHYTREVVQAERLTLVGRFARSIVHDFKNPLNIIGISADMTALDNATVEMRVAARTRIRRQVDRLSNMISELLEFTRGSGATVILARTEYGEYVRGQIEELRPELESRSVRIEFGNDPPPVVVLMDPRRLGHVFHNLLHNACDAMPEGGTVTLRFRASEAEIVTEIQDTGEGIAAEIAARLFQPFATHGKSSGTGLGLSICRKIVEDHRGTIRAWNAPGGGAVFSFTLPRAADSAPAAGAEPSPKS